MLRGRGPALMLVVIAWALVAVVASGPDPDRETWLGTSDLDTIVMVATFVFLGLCFAITVWLKPISRSEGYTPRKPRKPIGLLIMLVLVYIVALLRPDVLNAFRPQESDETLGAIDEAPEFDEAAEVDAEPVAEARDFILVVVVAGVAVGAWWLHRNRHRFALEEAPPSPADEMAAERFRAAVSAAEKQLTLGDDPRSAVIAAYVDLEQELRELGHGRRRWETSTEHLRRSLPALGTAPEPFLALQAIYERARFSELPIDESDRDEARQALATALRSVEIDS